MGYRRAVGGWMNIENDFYANNSPNDNLEKKINVNA